MTTLGGWGGLPLRMGGGKSQAQGIYESLRDGAGTAFSRDDYTRANRERRCMALAIARAAAAQERGGMQSLPDLATDRLPDWERALQAPTDPSQPRHVRAAVCMGILRGNGPAERDNIAAAVSMALGGESVSVLVSTARSKTFTYGQSPTSASAATGAGSLLAGTHYLYIATEDTSGVVTLMRSPTVLTVGNGDAIRVDPLSFGAGLTVHYYLSTAAGSTDVALVASQYGGASILLTSYPTDPPMPALHHLAVLVSAATATSASKVAAIHAVLGVMLPAWTTYSIITSSPFVLGTGGSELGLGGL